MPEPIIDIIHKCESWSEVRDHKRGLHSVEIFFDDKTVAMDFHHQLKVITEDVA